MPKLNPQLLGAALSCLPLFASAASYNVSERVLGIYEPINFRQAFKVLKQPCGDCTYSLMSSAAISTDAAPKIMPQAWPAPFHSTFVPPYEVASLDPTPQGYIDTDGDTHYYEWDFYERSETAYNKDERFIVSESFSSGDGHGLTHIHIKARNNALEARQYFAYFLVPVRNHATTFAYNLVPGSNGGTYVYKQQNSAASRSLAELIVDGLPVWEQTDSFHYPDDFLGNMFNDVDLFWGETGVSSATLFLGTLQAGESLDIDYNIRTAVQVDAPKCGTESISNWGSYDRIHHCYGVREKRELPITLSGSDTPLIEIYAKELP